MKTKWFVVISYLVLIHSLSSFSFNNSKIETFLGLDKIIHFFQFFFLTLLLWKPVCNFFNRTSINLITFGIFFFCVLNGFLDEYHQRFVDGRHSSYGDFLADVIGSGCCILYLRFTDKNNSFADNKFEEILESN